MIRRHIIRPSPLTLVPAFFTLLSGGEGKGKGKGKGGGKGKGAKGGNEAAGTLGSLDDDEDIYGGELGEDQDITQSATYKPRFKKKKPWEGKGGKGGKGGKEDREPQLLRAGQYIRPPKGTARSKLRWVRSRKSDAKKQSRFRKAKKQVVAIGDVMTVSELARELALETDACIDLLANDAYRSPEPES